MTQERLNKIVAALDANNIKYNKKFKNILNAGYQSDDCQHLSDKIVEDVERLVITVINGKKGLNDEIAELIDIAVDQSKNGAERKVRENSKKRDEIIKSVDNHQKEENMGIKQNTINYIDDTIAALDIVCDVAGTPEIKANLAKAREQLVKLKENIVGVWDERSKTAADYMGEVLEEVLSLRGAMDRYTCSAAIVKNIEKAVAISEKWAQLNTVPSRRETADDDYIKECWKKGDDGGNIELIIESERVKDEIHIFRDDLIAFNAETAAKCDDTKYKADLEERKARKDELIDMAKSAYIRSRNGEISDEEAADIMEQCDEEIEEIDIDIQQDNEDIAKLNEERRARYKNGRSCRRVVDKFLSYEDDPVMLAAIAKTGEINFEDLKGMILGRYGDEDSDAIADNILVNLKLIEANKRALCNGSRQWDRIRAESREGTQTRTATRQEGEKVDQAKRKEDLAKKFGIVQDTPKKQEEPEEEVVTGTNIPLTEDDK